MENEKQILESLYGIEITPEMEAEILDKNSADFKLGKY